MNSKPVELLDVVELDIEAAIAHYSTWRSDAREHFLDLLEETLAWVGWNPNLFPKKIGPIQRAIIKRSYFIVYYIQDSDRSVVLAILDGRDKPKRIQQIVGRRNPKR